MNRRRISGHSYGSGVEGGGRYKKPPAMPTIPERTPLDELWAPLEAEDLPDVPRVSATEYRQEREPALDS